MGGGASTAVFKDARGELVTVGAKAQFMMKDLDGNLTDFYVAKRGTGEVFRITGTDVEFKFPPTNTTILKYNQAGIEKFGIKILLPNDPKTSPYYPPPPEGDGAKPFVKLAAPPVKAARPAPEPTPAAEPPAPTIEPTAPAPAPPAQLMAEEPEPAAPAEPEPEHPAQLAEPEAPAPAAVEPPPAELGAAADIEPAPADAPNPLEA